jgi:hypothetical protein
MPGSLPSSLRKTGGQNLSLLPGITAVTVAIQGDPIRLVLLLDFPLPTQIWDLENRSCRHWIRRDQQQETNPNVTVQYCSSRLTSFGYTGMNPDKGNDRPLHLKIPLFEDMSIKAKKAYSSILLFGVSHL